MPKHKNANPSYRLHKRSGQAVVTLNGVDHYLGVYGTPESHAKYSQVINEWIARGKVHGTNEDLGDLTVSRIILGYWNAKTQKMAKAEIVKLKAALRPLREQYGTFLAAKYRSPEIGTGIHRSLPLGYDPLGFASEDRTAGRSP